MKKAVKKSAIKEKEVTKVLINGKDTMPVLATDEFKRHVGGTLHRVFGTTGRTEAAAASKRNESGFATIRTFVFGTAESGGAAVNHLVDVFNFDRTRMKCIYDFFIMIGKDLLQNIHTIIMQQMIKKENYPSRLRGRGVE